VTHVTDVRELSLADLLDTRVDIASKKPQTARETPGIVTVITRDDIISSGARVRERSQRACHQDLYPARRPDHARLLSRNGRRQ
jgi:hypothetical protein